MFIQRGVKLHFFLFLCYSPSHNVRLGGRRVIGISGSLIWSKTLMELMFNPCFLTSSLVPWDLFRSFRVCSDAKERKRVGCGKQWEATAPIKSLVILHLWFLSLWWKTCLRHNCRIGFSACSEGPAFGQNTLMMVNIRLTTPGT